MVEVAVVLTREAGDNVAIEELRASAEDLYSFEKQLARVNIFVFHFLHFELTSTDS